MMKEVVVFAPGTIANLGPGFDCLGLCLDELGDQISMRLAESDRIEVVGRDASDVPTDFKVNCIGLVVHAVRQSLGKDVALAVSLERSLPLSGGLGASAASSMGAALATSILLGHDPSLIELLEWALVGEEAVAGRHLDNLAPCLLGGLTFSTFSASSAFSSPLVRSFPVKGDFTIALVTPRVRVNTAEARQLLPNQVDKDVYLRGISSVSGTLSALLVGDHDLLRETMRDPYAVPVRKNLVPHYDEAIEAASRVGALASCLSGSGPSLFSLCPDFDVASDVLETWGQIYGHLGASLHLCKPSLPICRSLDEKMSFMSIARGHSSRGHRGPDGEVVGGIRVLSMRE